MQTKIGENQVDEITDDEKLVEKIEELSWNYEDTCDYLRGREDYTWIGGSGSTAFFLNSKNEVVIVSEHGGVNYLDRNFRKILSYLTSDTVRRRTPWSKEVNLTDV
jgi:hypothetical protein